MGADRLYSLKVLAFDARSGKPLWDRTVYDGVMYDNRHRKNTYASSTMVTDGRAVYAFFESGGLYAFDMAGKPLWQKSLGGIGKGGMGPGTSPIVFEDLIILQCDQEMGGGSFIVALRAGDGSEVWRQDVHDAAQLGDAAHRAHAAPASRWSPPERKWSLRMTRGPARSSGARTAPRAIRFQCRRRARPRVPDGRQPGQARHGHSARRRRRSQGLAIDRLAVCEGDRLRAVADPRRARYLYLMTDAGIMTCLDALSGKVVYEGGRPPVPATFTASLVCVRRSPAGDQRGRGHIHDRTGPTHEVLRTNSVGEPVYASLALAGGTIYVRGAQHLFAIRAGR